MVVKTLNGFFKNLITIRSTGSLGTLLYVNTNLMGNQSANKNKHFHLSLIFMLKKSGF